MKLKYDLPATCSAPHIHNFLLGGFVRVDYQVPAIQRTGDARMVGVDPDALPDVQWNRSKILIFLPIFPCQDRMLLADSGHHKTTCRAGF